MNIPEDCLCNKGHMWCRREDDDTVIIGVSDHAQESLGEITYIELPATGATVTRDESLGLIESTKVVNELLSPVSGTVIETNDNLSDSPAVVNEDPYGDGWMLRVRIESADQLETLMDASKYSEYIA